MLFHDLALYFKRLEETSLRNLMTEILAELFKKTDKEDISKICYLLQGRVVPIYESLEFGMADKMVMTAIARAFKETQARVTELFKERGDLGKVVEKLHKGSQEDKGRLTVSQVYQSLYQIAKTGGSGAVEKKVEILSQLLRNSSSISGRYIARIPLDKLRLGFSDMTILDALSYMVCGSKELRGKIEAAYNVYPDLGLVAQKIKERGIAGVSDIEPRVGTPILMAKADRLSTSGEILAKIGKCAVEYKYDGLRLQVHYKRSKDQKIKRSNGVTIKVFSRNLEDVTNSFPDIREAVVKQITAEEVIFEGEVVAFNPKTGVSVPFQQTMQRKRKYDIEKKVLEIPVKLYVFELLFCNGKNYLKKPYRERKAKLKEILKSGEIVHYAQEAELETAREIEELFEKSVAGGYEGIIAKKLDGEYQAGMRGFNWIKFKRAMRSTLTDTFDVLVMGYTKGEGKRTQFGMGQFLTGVYDNKNDKFLSISKIGTGLTDEQFREFVKRVKPLEVGQKPVEYDVDKLVFADVWLRASLVVEVRADEITRSQVHTAGRLLGPSKSGKALEVKEPGFALRFPRLIRFRDDKKPTDATTLSEVVKMFSKQKSS